MSGVAGFGGAARAAGTVSGMPELRGLGAAGYFEGRGIEVLSCGLHFFGEVFYIFVMNNNEWTGVHTFIRSRF